MEKIIAKYNSMELSKFQEAISKLSIDILKKLKANFDNRYYNTGEETIDDIRYDIFLEVLQELDPTLNNYIGCSLRKADNKTKLPFFLGGMDKIKKGEDKKIETWIKNNKKCDYVISDKLNGVSCLIVYTKAGNVRLYTRGDGVEGADISYFADKIKIPKLKMDIAVRGELIITMKNFEEKYKESYKNSLSLIVSVVNSKTLKEPIKDIEFIAYEIVDGCNENLETQLKKLETLNFSVVKFNTHTKISSDTLIQELLSRKQTSVYDIDGVIVFSNSLYTRCVDRNPDYAFAFKMLMEVAEAEVVDVEWNVSKWGILKPRIEIKPIQLTGITITHTTGFNAAFIQSNKINKGTKLLITRSGDIIPYIVKVLTESDIPKMPDVEYTWNETNVDVMINKDDNTQLIVQQLIHFFVSMNIRQINEGVVSKLVNSGYNTIQKILALKVADFRNIPTFKDKMSERLYTNIHSTLKLVTIPDLMCASGCFGFGLGKKRADILCKAIPNILTENLTTESIEKVEGFSKKTALKILNNIQSFKDFIKSIEEYISIEKKDEIQTTLLSGNKYVFSGFRDKSLEEYIVKNGGSISTSISSKTTYLVVLDKEASSSKIDKAKELGVKLILESEF